MNRLTRVLAALAATSLLTSAAPSKAATLTAGAMLDSAAPVFTVDPDGNRDAVPAARNVAADRNLRQSFTYTGADRLLVDDIRLSLNIPDQQLGGLELRVYRVVDANASSFAAAGGSLIDILLVDAATPVPSAGDYVQIQLDPNDPNEQLVLHPNLSYAVELSNNDGTTNFGSWRHTNNSTGGPDGGVLDLYEQGKFYTESGGQSGAGHRDAGVSINGTPTNIPEPTSLLLMVGGAALMMLRRR